MSFFVFLLLWVGTTAIQWGLAAAQQGSGPAPAKASGLGDFQIPTVDATRVIPVVCGTVLLRGINVLWYGDLLTEAIKQDVPGPFFGLGGSQITIGYRYFLGMQIALCQGPIDQVRGVWSDNEPLNFTIATLGDHLRVSLLHAALTIFGGTIDATHWKAGPTPVGDVDVFIGNSTQNPSDYLQAATGLSLPAYRTLAYAVLRQCYVGESTYLKDLAFEISKYPNTLGLTGGKHIIAVYDANPACHLYDVLINQDWGKGYDTSLIDLASFQAAGNALYTEGLGLSITHDTASDADQVIQEICRHIDAVVYRDPQTNLLTLRLIRNDYSLSTLPVLDESMVDDLDLTRPSWSELSNTIDATFTSRADAYTKRPAAAQNDALIQIQGAVVPVELQFEGASRAEVADMLALRECKHVSYPIARLTLKVNRQAWKLTPGAPFKVNWAPLGIAGLVCRVTKPSYGELENPEITIEAVEDIFSLGTTTFSGPPPSGWLNPVAAPVPVAAQLLAEVPYHLIGDVERLAMALAVRGAGATQGFEIWSDRAGGTNYVRTNIAEGFCASGLLVGAYAKSTAATDTTGFTVDGGADLVTLLSCSDPQLLAGRNLALVDGEIVSWRDVVDNGDGTFTFSHVMRGVLDSVPGDHADNARVWFFLPGGAALVDRVAYPADGTISARLLTFNSRGVLPIASATATTVTTASRAQKPYPPGNVKVGGVAWPATVAHGVDQAVTWNHRHRLAQFTDSRVVAQDAGDYVVTPEGNYTIEVRVGGGSPVRTVTALTGTSWTWTAAFQAADGAVAGASVSIRIIPVNGALLGTYQERLFTMT